MSAVLLRSGLVLLLLCCLLVHGQRIAQKKCSEYRKKTIQTSMIIPLTLNPRPIQIQRFNCSKTVDLIVGGEAAKPGEFPHQALLGYPDDSAPEGYKFDCGGSLISERFVLTAAHCFAQGYPTIVRLAEHSLQDEYDNQIDFEIEQSFRHPQYKFKSAYNDIALIKLDQDVRLSKLIRPACLWTGSDFNVSSVIATGFGLNDTVGDKADILQKVMLDFLDRDQCVEKYGKQKKFAQGVLDSQLCIGSLRGGKDTCQGDSGGPVQVITEPKGCTYHILGVTSTALSGCGIGQSAAIYTRVSSYIDWIEKTVWPDEV